MKSWEKLNSIAEKEFGEFGFATLVAEEMETLIDMQKADRIARKKGEYGFTSCDEETMIQIIDENPSLLRV